MLNVFVYGTLRKGQIRHEVLKGSLFIGYGLLKGYDMYSLGNFPAIVKGNGIVYGEVYSINEETLKILDYIEGVDYELYKRELQTIELESGEVIEAFVYVFSGNLSGATYIREGDWLKAFKKEKDKNERKI